MKRVLLKLSGEALAGEQKRGFEPRSSIVFPLSQYKVFVIQIYQEKNEYGGFDNFVYIGREKRFYAAYLSETYLNKFVSDTPHQNGYLLVAELVDELRKKQRQEASKHRGYR